VRVEIVGVTVEPKGRAIAMSASSPDDTNSITEPRKIVPVTSDVDGLGASFTRTLPPYSITVLEVKGK
jgi:alpha-N-arabinofuranosidase